MSGNEAASQGASLQEAGVKRKKMLDGSDIEPIWLRMCVCSAAAVRDTTDDASQRNLTRQHNRSPLAAVAITNTSLQKLGAHTQAHARTHTLTAYTQPAQRDFWTGLGPLCLCGPCRPTHSPPRSTAEGASLLAGLSHRGARALQDKAGSPQDTAGVSSSRLGGPLSRSCPCPCRCCPCPRRPRPWPPRSPHPRPPPPRTHPPHLGVCRMCCTLAKRSFLALLRN